MLLAACGGGSGNPPPVRPPDLPPATLTAGADAVTILWNTASAIDVLANDKASRGTLTLSAVGAAAHGTVTVSNGKLVYTPAAGFYGTEKLSYTATANEGGASAQGEAVVTVEAVLTLRGNASDKPLANATVTAKVGSQTFSTTTNATGDFSLTVRSSAARDFVVLDAAGSGAQATVKLTSLVGDVDSLARRADANGQVTIAAVPALAVSHYTSAAAALATAALGKVPATMQALQEAAPLFTVGQTLHAATAVRLVADHGLPLPAGIADTLALVHSPAAVEQVHAAAVAIDPQLATTTRAAVERELDSGAPFTLGGLDERTVAYAAQAMVITYKADGTGRMSGSKGERSLTWVADGPTVRLTYERPTVRDMTPGYALDRSRVRQTATGMIIRMVMHDSAAKVGETGTVVWLEGPNVGQTAPVTGMSVTNAATYLTNVYYADRRLPIEMQLIPGAALSGPFNIPNPVEDTVYAPGQGFIAHVWSANDALELTSSTEATFAFGQQAASYAVQDRWLTLTRADGNVWRFAMLSKPGAGGMGAWLAELNGRPIKQSFGAIVVPQPRLKFTPAMAMKQYTYALAYGQLANDGSIVYNTRQPGSSYGEWMITPAGELDITYRDRQTGAVLETKRYLAVSVDGARLMVLMSQARPDYATTTSMLGLTSAPGAAAAAAVVRR